MMSPFPMLRVRFLRKRKTDRHGTSTNKYCSKNHNIDVLPIGTAFYLTKILLTQPLLICQSFSKKMCRQSSGSAPLICFSRSFPLYGPAHPLCTRHAHAGAADGCGRPSSPRSVLLPFPQTCCLLNRFDHRIYRASDRGICIASRLQRMRHIPITISEVRSDRGICSVFQLRHPRLIQIAVFAACAKHGICSAFHPQCLQRTWLVSGTYFAKGLKNDYSCVIFHSSEQRSIK